MVNGELVFNNPDENLFYKIKDINVKDMYFVSNIVARHMIENKI